jgi:AraC-like DNA-binding protein
MKENSAVIASGNLATRLRTINGLLGQFALLETGRERALEILTGAGLPERALDEPDFPISLEQELTACLGLTRDLPGGHSPLFLLFNVRARMGIENLGVLGMAMRHAANPIEALETCIRYPQLTWGHSRMTVRREGGGTCFVFAMERPRLRDAPDGDIDRLVQYCLVLDLVTSLRNMEDIAGSAEPPLYITFPFPEPEDWAQLRDTAPCPVSFTRSETCLALPTAMDSAPLPRSNPQVYRSYVSIADRLATLLVEEISLRERVTRWLWAYSPPPDRAQVASLLAMSERNLTRQLGREGISYARLRDKVQEERARNFLSNPGLSVSEVAERLGYSEPAAFSRAFTRWTGTSPLKWRRGQRALD